MFFQTYISREKIKRRAKDRENVGETEYLENAFKQNIIDDAFAYK